MRSAQTVWGWLKPDIVREVAWIYFCRSVPFLDKGEGGLQNPEHFADVINGPVTLARLLAMLHFPCGGDMADVEVERSIGGRWSFGCYLRSEEGMLSYKILV